MDSYNLLFFLMHFHLETPQFLGGTSALTWAVKEEPECGDTEKLHAKSEPDLDLDMKIRTISPSPSCCCCLHLPWRKKKKNPPHVYFNNCICSVFAAWRSITNLHFIIQTCVYIITHKSPWTLFVPGAAESAALAAWLLLSTLASPSALFMSTLKQMLWKRNV